MANKLSGDILACIKFGWQKNGAAIVVTDCISIPSESPIFEKLWTNDCKFGINDLKAITGAIRRKESEAIYDRHKSEFCCIESSSSDNVDWYATWICEWRTFGLHIKKNHIKFGLHRGVSFTYK